MSKERWVAIWPPPKVQENPEHMLVEEKGCEDCKEFFGWVYHRSYSKGLDTIICGVSEAVGYWNEDQTMFTVLGWFSARSNKAGQAYEHIKQIK